MASKGERQHLFKDKSEDGGCTRTKLCIGILLGVVFGAGVAVAITLPFVLDPPATNYSATTNYSVLPTTNHSATEFYAKAAVASDAKPCSDIGSQVLRDGGSAVDAAIAALVCVGVVNAHSAGLGGGLQMVVYAAPPGETKKVTTAIVAREMAPAAATEYMFEGFQGGTENIIGGRAVAVPGDVLGYYEAWKRFGRVRWRRLFEPTIKLCRTGFTVGFALAGSILMKLDMIENSTTMSKVFLKADQTPYRPGDIMRRPDLIETLEIVASDNGVYEYYNGTLAKKIVEDLQEAGSIITKKDLQNYRVNVTSSLNMPLSDGKVLYTIRPPAGGALLGFILRVLEGYKLTPQDFRQIDTYQKMMEAFKFAGAEKTYLGDEAFSDDSEAMANLTSFAFADYIRERINLNHTENITYYNPALTDPMLNSGTTHLSVLAPDGSAVSLTSSINAHFGSGVMGPRSSILFNNQMNDFWWPNQTFFTLNGSKTAWDFANEIQPGKRPMSGMCPTIVVNSNGDVTMVIGAAGAQEIPSTVAYVASQMLWLGRSFSEAVDELRLYHVFIPNVVEYDTGFSEEILSELQERGHRVRPLSGITVFQGITSACNRKDVNPSTCIEAISDWRKGGASGGF